MGGFELNMTFVWLIAMVALLVIEAIVPGLVSIWFAAGALLALLLSLIGMVELFRALGIRKEGKPDTLELLGYVGVIL